MRFLLLLKAVASRECAPINLVCACLALFGGFHAGDVRRVFHSHRDERGNDQQFLAFYTSSRGQPEGHCTSTDSRLCSLMGLKICSRSKASTRSGTITNVREHGRALEFESLLARTSTALSQCAASTRYMV